VLLSNRYESIIIEWYVIINLGKWCDRNYDRVNPCLEYKLRCSHTDRSALCVSDTTTGICLDIYYLVGGLIPIWLFKLRLLSPSGLFQWRCKHLWYPIVITQKACFVQTKIYKSHSYIAQGKFRYTAHSWHTWLSLLYTLHHIQHCHTSSSKCHNNVDRSTILELTETESFASRIEKFSMIPLHRW
jgi:hypothetical protein